MRELVKVFDNTVLKIDVINQKEFMIDVSGIAKRHGKRFDKWAKSERVKEILKKGKFSVSEPILKVGHMQKIHNKLLISFARYISVDFEIWCDEMIYDILTKKKDEEIKRLIAEKKMCMVTPDGYTSIRGITQRTIYTEKQIREFAESLGLIEKEIRKTMFWRIKDPMDGLAKEGKGYKTPYFHLKDMESLLNQYYGNDEEEEYELEA